LGRIPLDRMASVGLSRKKYKNKEGRGGIMLWSVISRKDNRAIKTGGVGQ